MADRVPCVPCVSLRRAGTATQFPKQLAIRPTVPERAEFIQPRVNFALYTGVKFKYIAHVHENSSEVGFRATVVSDAFRNGEAIEYEVQVRATHL
jgi:hypothetical protein